VLVRVRLGDGRQDAFARIASRQAEDALNGRMARTPRAASAASAHC
jgi:hypothetical protein